MKLIPITARIWCLCLSVLIAAPSFGARVDNLYEAEAPLGSSSGALEQAMAAALREVLVKVTGTEDIARDADVAGRFGDASRFVQQYRIENDGTVWVRFDEPAVRRELDAAGAPVWGAERPAVMAWLIVDDGNGPPHLLTAAAAGDTPVESVSGVAPAAAAADLDAAMRTELLDAADARGLPLMLPPANALAEAAVSIGDIRAGRTGELVELSEAYGANAALIGRVQAAPPGPARVRWALRFDEGNFDWSGDIVSGPDSAATMFARRLATSVGASSRIVLSVDEVENLDDYGRLSAYLRGLDMIDACEVEEVVGRRVIFSLEVRGNATRLMRSIALQRVLQPLDDGRAPAAGGAAAPGLHYRLMAGP